MTSKIAPILCFIFFISMSTLLKAQTAPTYDRGMYQSKTDTLPYRILFPLNFDPAKKYPVIFFLHGSGERGNDNEAQLKHCGDAFLKDSIRQNYPAIVIFPQCPAEGNWSDNMEQDDSTGNKFTFFTDAKPTPAMHALMAFVEDFLDKPYVNKHQVYLGGLSIGGMGTFELIGRKPSLFAAAFPMSGGDNPLNAKKYAKKVPVWIFHGAKDSTVTPDHSEIMVEAIKAAGGDPKFTLFPNDGHDCWDDALAEPGFFAWLFANKK